MNKERREAGYIANWDSSTISKYLVENFDRIIKLEDFASRQAETKIFTDLLRIRLVFDKIPQDTVDRLQFNIIHAKSKDPDPQDPILIDIKHKLSEAFGDEVVRRVNISLSDTKVPQDILFTHETF